MAIMGIFLILIGGKFRNEAMLVLSEQENMKNLLLLSYKSFCNLLYGFSKE
jgi:hypothetical protein